LTICGADVSGFTNRLTNYEMVWKAGPLWSGGGYGPEGGLLTTLAFSLWAIWAWKGPIYRRTPWMLTARPPAVPETANRLELAPSDPRPEPPR
jgi:hypothetical protein